jgi:hypothetical protein
VRLVPQKRHTMACALMVSAQNGHCFSSCMVNRVWVMRSNESA